MGAHLGVNGVVNGNSVVCSFHAWEFGGDGVCTRIPYSDAPIPSAAKVASWSVCELHGIVFVSYHAEKLAPQYELPLLDDVVSGKMLYHGSQSQGLVNMHVQDLAENSTDFAHFRSQLSSLHMVFW